MTVIEEVSADHAAANRCPKCNSPAPHLHPAVQNEGEVHLCDHPFHQRRTPENRSIAFKEENKS